MADTQDLVLIVDDNPQNIQYLGNLLTKNGYRLGVAQTGERALEFVKNQSPDIILLDIMMPGMDGYSVCDQLQLDHEHKSIPVIFITAKTDENSIEKAYDCGGRDYVTKPFKPKELLARVKTHLELKHVLNRLEYSSSHDQLTGLYNRSKLDACLEREIDRSNRYGCPLSVILMDIDHFKMVNDKLGHQAGDTVLQDVAATIKASVRSVDIIGRWGGEEFLIVCPETSLESAAVLAEKLREMMESWDLKSVKPTGSFGVAELGRGEDDNGLIRRADRALYAAKENGRNRVEKDKFNPA